MELTPLIINSSKIHVHAEIFSSKTNWKLEERLLYNKIVRNIHTELGKKGRKLAG